MTVDGIIINGGEDFSKEEIRYFISQIMEKENRGGITEITLSSATDGTVKADYEIVERKFERIRRITGYLVGTIDRWNNAKKSEECERVKHQ